MIPIYTTTLASDGSVTFDNIPQGYTDLVIIADAKRALGGAGAATMAITFNQVTSGALYSSTLLYSGGGYTVQADSWQNVGQCGDANNGDFTPNKIEINQYSATDKHKIALSRFGNASMYTAGAVALWRSNAAITRIDISCANSIKAGSTFTLYGIKAA